MPNYNATRVGKLALLAALSDEQEEAALKESLAGQTEIRLAITFISGVTTKINTTFTKTIMNSALQGDVIKKNSRQLHALLHASIEAYQGLTPHSGIQTSIKMKVGIVADSKWIAVAVYGDSAFSAFTNHERSGLGIMHL